MYDEFLTINKKLNPNFSYYNSIESFKKSPVSYKCTASTGFFLRIRNTVSSIKNGLEKPIAIAQYAVDICKPSLVLVNKTKFRINSSVKVTFC